MRDICRTALISLAPVVSFLRVTVVTLAVLWSIGPETARGSSMLARSTAAFKEQPEKRLAPVARSFVRCTTTDAQGRMVLGFCMAKVAPVQSTAVRLPASVQTQQPGQQLAGPRFPAQLATGRKFSRD